MTNVKTCQTTKRATCHNVPNVKTCQTSQRVKRAHLPNVLMCHSAHIPRPKTVGAPTSLCHECQVPPRAKRPLPMYHASHITTPHVSDTPISESQATGCRPHITTPHVSGALTITSVRHTCRVLSQSHQNATPAGWPHSRAKRPRVPGAMVMENSCRARHCVGRPDFIIYCTVQKVFSSLPFTVLHCKKVGDFPIPSRDVTYVPNSPWRV